MCLSQTLQHNRQGRANLPVSRWSKNSIYNTHNLDHYYLSQRGGAYHTHELINVSQLLSLFPTESVPRSSYNCRKDHLTFWVHLRWDHDSCGAAAVLIRTSVARLVGLSCYRHRSHRWHGVGRINEVTLRWARFVLGRVTVFGRTCHLGNKDSHSGQLSLAVPPWVCTVSTGSGFSYW